MRIVRLVVTFAIAIVSSLTFQQDAAQAFPVSNITLVGHGYGHGRGLSQYGALGYAVDAGWSWQQILDHYYQGTSFGAGAGNPTIGVRIMEFDNLDTIVTSASPFTVGGFGFAGGEATLVHRNSSNNFTVKKAASCAGPWTDVGGRTGNVDIIPANLNQGNNENLMLRMCTSTGYRGVRGTISSVEASGTIQTVNSLSTQDYLRGVLPCETPASWGDLSGGKGMHALRAQAVAARSYLLAGPKYAYATTCNTTACQVYGGAFLNGQYIEDSRSDQAVNDTSGIVRRFGNGSIALTEFSSSSGGYTAGGTFPAVVDDGDAYSGNANHNWSKTVSISEIESKFSSVGSLQNISVIGRNGFGDMGGRVTTVRIAGSSGTTDVSGAAFRATFNLKSDWFLIQGVPSGGVYGYQMLGDDGGLFSMGAARFYGSMGGRPLNKPIVNVTRTPTSNGYWEIASDGGIFSFGDAKFFGSMGGRPLNKPIVGMTSTASGNGYWMVASDGGIFSFGDAKFFGSMGGRPLNKPIVGMTSTASGNGYWMVASDGGIFSFGDAKFFGSMGGRPLNKPIVGMTSTASGNGYWMVASDGGIFSFGDAGFFGSQPSGVTITGFAASVDGQGYVMVSSNGRVFAFGSAPNFGDIVSVVPGYKGRIVSISPTT